MPTRDELKILQALPLEAKVARTEQRIREFVTQMGEDGVYISFSGGKDSTVLLHIARRIYPEIRAVFVDTGLEYPEIKSFVKTFDNVDIIRPRRKFNDVITDRGYPLLSKEISQAVYYARRNLNPRPHYDIVARRKLLPPQDTAYDTLITNLSGQDDAPDVISLDDFSFDPGVEYLPSNRQNKNMNTRFSDKYNYQRWSALAQHLPARISHLCCYDMKKSPMKIYHSHTKRCPIMGTMASESLLRAQSWLKQGCNSFLPGREKSNPMAFWMEQDVLQYIVDNNLSIASPYGKIVMENDSLRCSGAQRTGCMFCGFGMHLELGKTRFDRLKASHPAQYEFSINGGHWIDNPDYDPSIKAVPDSFGWTPWNPKKIWVPSQEGLGMGKVFDMANDIMGEMLWRY